MNNPPIAELRAGDAVTGVYLVNRREMKTTKTGKPYLWLVIRDKTGSLPGNYWDAPTKLAETIVEGCCVRLRASV